MQLSNDDTKTSIPPSELPSKLYPQFILFGDSITQRSWASLVPALSEQYLRRFDIINRGLSGYNSSDGLRVLKQFFPILPPSSTNPQVKLMTLFFGANDASIPGYKQHVSLEKYKANLRAVINYEGVKLHGTQIILITPPPVDEWRLENEFRKADRARMYAEACKDVAAEYSLPVLDLWSIFMDFTERKPGHSEVPFSGKKEAPRSSALESLLTDGLHLTDHGYDVFTKAFIQLIHAQLPDFVPAEIPMVFQEWTEFTGQEI